MANYKRKNTKREHNRKFFNYYYGFKKSFKLDYISHREFKKNLRNKSFTQF